MTDATSSERLKAMNSRFAALAKASPQALGAFRSLMLETSKAGALQTKFKELVAVAIAVHQGCSDCILFHVSNARCRPNPANCGRKDPTSISII